jgi:hypothetical protein
VRDLADKYGAVLVYDGNTDRLQTQNGRRAGLYGVTPDNRAGRRHNGYPISVVTGKKNVMAAAGSKLFSLNLFSRKRRVCRRAEASKSLGDRVFKYLGRANAGRKIRAIDKYDVEPG